MVRTEKGRGVEKEGEPAGGLGGRVRGGGGSAGLFNGEDVFGHRCRLDERWTGKLRDHPRQNVLMKGKLDLSSPVVSVCLICSFLLSSRPGLQRGLQERGIIM